jgi:putative peptidoglycan lipid II flippase
LKSIAEKSSLAKSAGIVSAATFVSRLLGLVREQVTAYLFGASDQVDAFKSAFRIPNLLRDMFAEGALSAGFVPIFSEKLRTGSKEDAIRFAGMVFGALTAIVSVVVLLMMVFTPEIAVMLASGFEKIPGKLENTILMGRVMMPFLLMMALAALLMGISNSLGYFGVPALAPVMLNIGMIICSIALSPFVHPPVLSIAIGVLVGGFGQFVMQYIALRRIGFRFQIIFDLFNPDLLRLLLLIIPTVIGLAATQINVAVITRIASNDSGAVSYLDYAFRLLHLPLGLFAIAIATVALPKLAGEAAGGNLLGFNRIHSSALRLGLFLSLPATIVMVLLSREICGAVYQYGKFTSEDTLQTARALSMYCVGLPFFTLVRITVPAFYALKDTRTPALISVFSVVLNIFFCFQLRGTYGFVGLALAASLAGVANFALLTYLLRSRIDMTGDRDNLIALGKIVAASLVTGMIVWLMKHFLFTQIQPSRLVNLGTVTAMIAVAAAAYLVLCRWLRIEEWTRVADALTRRFRR